MEYADLEGKELWGVSLTSLTELYLALLFHIGKAKRHNKERGIFGMCTGDIIVFLLILMASFHHFSSNWCHAY